MVDAEEVERLLNSAVFQEAQRALRSLWADLLNRTGRRHVIRFDGTSINLEAEQRREW